MMMMNCFCGMIDRRKAFGLISSRDSCQNSSTSPISDTPQTGLYTTLPRDPSALIPHVSCILRVLVAHVPCALSALVSHVPHALHALVLHMPRTLYAVMLYIPHTLHALLLTIMISNL